MTKKNFELIFLRYVNLAETSMIFFSSVYAKEIKCSIAGEKKKPELSVHVFVSKSECLMVV
jgi:hypothetical protein